MTSGSRCLGPPAAILLLLVALLVSCAELSRQPDVGHEEASEQLLDEVDKLVRSLMRRQRVPGLSIGVVHEGRTLVLRGYGEADREHGVPVRPDTIFRGYSIAKLITGLEVVRLAEEGVIDLDQPVAQVVPEWSGMHHYEPSVPVTIRHLLAHRGGLPRNSNFRPTGPVPIDDVLRLAVESMVGVSAAYPAGTRYKYSNIGYNVLGRAIEVARGESFGAYMTFDVLAEYGMDHSAFFTGFLPDDSVLATGYVRERSRFHPTQRYDLNEIASGNLFTNATDLVAFMRTILETPVTGSGPLSVASLEESYAPQFASVTDPERTGLAWATSQEMAGELIVWHQGGDADANALVALAPDSRTGVCLLSNTGSYEGTALLTLAVDVIRAVRSESGDATPDEVAAESPLDEPPDTPTAPHPALLPAAECFTGRYVAYGQLITVEERRGRVLIDFGIARLGMEPSGRTQLGTEYSLRHWLGDLVERALPISLDLVRVVVPPAATGKRADHLWIAASDASYEYCPRYEVPTEVPESWLEVAGEYAGCTVLLEDDAIRMSGVGYLRAAGPGVFRVVGGPYAGETVTYDMATGSLSHQGLEYERQ